MASVICIVTELLMGTFAGNFIEENNYLPLFDDGSSGGTLIIIVALAFIISIILKNTLFKNTTARAMINVKTTKGTIITIVICALMLSFGLYRSYAESYCFTAINENGIYHCESFSDKEIIDLTSDRVELFYIEGNSYYDNNDVLQYENDACDKALYLVIDNNYEDYIYCGEVSGYDNSDALIDEVVTLFEDNSGKSVTHLKDEREFREIYHLD